MDRKDSTSNTAHESKQRNLVLKKIDQAYASPTWWYDIRGFFILTFAYRSNIFQQIRFFNGNMKDKHLEVAIGTGTLFDLILKWRKLSGAPQIAITGFDYAEKMLDGAKKRFAKAKNVNLLRADVGHLQFADNSFDSANIANSLHCFPTITSGLSEIFRVLTPGGTLALNVLLYPEGKSFLQKVAGKINQWGMKKGILYSPYKKANVIQALKKCGYEILQDEVHGNCANILARKPANVLGTIQRSQGHRISDRIPLEVAATIGSHAALISNLSSGGLGVLVPDGQDLQGILSLVIVSDVLQTKKLQVKVVWKKDNYYGLEVLDHTKTDWMEDLRKLRSGDIDVNS